MELASRAGASPSARNECSLTPTSALPTDSPRGRGSYKMARGAVRVGASPSARNDCSLSAASALPTRFAAGARLLQDGAWRRSCRIAGLGAKRLQPCRYISVATTIRREGAAPTIGARGAVRVGARPSARNDCSLAAASALPHRFAAGARFLRSGCDYPASAQAIPTRLPTPTPSAPKPPVPTSMM